MKKVSLLFDLLFIAAVINIKAQSVAAFGFESFAGTWDEITDGTIIASGTAITQNTIYPYSSNTPISGGVKEYEGFDIGFDFLFNDVVMNKFVVGTHFFISVGQNSVVVDSVASSTIIRDFGAAGKTNVIGCNYIRTFTGTAATVISYKLEGTTPERVLTVQYKNMNVATTNANLSPVPVNFQIRLLEIGNIEFVFSGWDGKPAGSGNQTAWLGICGSMSGDTHRRTGNWSSSTKSTNASITISWGPDAYPVNGLTYRFIKPDVCAAPAVQPTDAVMSATTTSISGSFTAAESVDRYLVLMSESATLSQSPIDGTYYTVNQTIGNATVLGYTEGNTFSASSLTGNKTYYFTVFVANSHCSYGPKYNTAAPLSASFATLPAPPESLTVLENDIHTAKLSVQANTTGNNILIAITNVPRKNAQNQVLEGGTFGTPQGTYQLNDEITGGGKVIYMGGTSENIVLEGLTDNVIYHLQAWSVNSSGDYSSTYLMNSFLTLGKVPYSTDYTRERLSQPPFGWSVDGVSSMIKQNSTWGTGSWLMQSPALVGSEVAPAIMTLTSPWIQLGEAKNRIDFRYYFSEPTGVSAFYVALTSENWIEGSFFDIQLSIDDVEYISVYKVDKNNCFDFAYPRNDANMRTMRTPPFTTYNGQLVKVRLVWNFAQRHQTYMEDIHIEQVGECDRIYELAVNSISLTNGEAQISWNNFNEEANLWEVRWRKTGNESNEWTEPVETSSNTHKMTGLPEVTEIEVQVRVKCSLSSTSFWESIVFTTGYEVPFTETFDDNSLPHGWIIESGVIGAATTSWCTTNCNYKWRVANNKLNVTFGVTQSTRFRDWAMLPLLNVGDGSYNCKLDFDFSVSTTGTIPANTYFAVVISEDGGLTWNTDGILLNLPITDENINNFESHYTISLAGKTGNVKLSFYIECPTVTTNPVSITIDNVSVTETCTAATNVIVSDITANEAVISWDGEDDTWLIFVREKGSTDEDFEENTEKILELSGLESATTYQAGITRICDEDDNAKLIIVEFTTSATEPCDEVTDIDAVPTKYSVILSWNGDGISYNVRFREEGTANWTQRSVETANIEFSGLDPNTTYEYSIQAVCSNADGDISDWSETDVVTTLPITCFPPSDIIIDPIEYESATVYWEGDAADYEVAYRIVGGEWGASIEVNGSQSCYLENLLRLTNYQVRVRSICTDDESSWSSAIPFLTPDIPPCAYPLNLTISELTTVSVKFTWNEGNDQNLKYDLHYRETSTTTWNNVFDLEEKTYFLFDLKPNTAYIWSVRAKCSEDRTSSWATQNNFTTYDIPPCSAPINLSVSEITETSAELSWAAGNDENLSWELRYRVASNSTWNDVANLVEKTYLLENLTPNTAYLWTVRANCSYDRTSEWGTQNDFTTKDQGGISNNQKLPLTVYASGKMINIINPDNKYIENVQLFDINGKLIGDYSVKGVGNVLIPAIVVESVAIVKVIGKNEVESHKILNK